MRKFGFGGAFGLDAGLCIWRTKRQGTKRRSPLRGAKPIMCCFREEALWMRVFRSLPYAATATGDWRRLATFLREPPLRFFVPAWLPGFAIANSSIL